MKEKIKQLQKILDQSHSIVVLSGAGVSTDSGLKDFRSENGIYQEKYSFSPEEMLSAKMFYEHPQDFYQFYQKTFNCLDAKPNATHYYLKKLEDQGKLKAVITQNIDGLDAKAGIQNVLEIHGSIYRNYCTNCHAFYDADYIFQAKGIPQCQKCQGIIKPDVVLYGEMLPDCFEKAILEIEKADTFLVLGTSLSVYPASSLVRYFQGKNLIIINQEVTPYDEIATLVIHENLNQIFQNLK